MKNLSSLIQRGIRYLTFCIIATIILVACKGPAAPAEPTSTPPPPPTDTAVPTDTPIPTATPVPTDTPLPTDTPTLEPTPTPDLPATAAVEATQAAQKAMETVGKELEEIGESPQNGQLAWVQKEPVVLSVNEYLEKDSKFIDPDLVAQDFIFQSAVTWESTGGLAGCGFNFRAEKDLEVGAFYNFLTIRLSGLPVWWVLRVEYNTVQDNMSAKYPVSSAINQKQGSTNIYTIVAKGNSFAFYANGKRLGTVFNGKIADGRIAFHIRQESGETTCTFDKSWLWVLEQE